MVPPAFTSALSQASGVYFDQLPLTPRGIYRYMEEPVRINFMLNGTPESVDSDADVRLIDILRDHFKLIGTHAGCYSGECGSCIVLINGEIFHACMTPLFRVRGMRVTTIEGFAKQSDYKEIMAGFKEAGLSPCRFCAAGRILITHALLDISPKPRRGGDR